MIEQQKILRVFKLIKLLNDKPRRGIYELAKLLECSDKSIYRYLHLLEELGYLIDKDKHNQFFIFEPTSFKTSSFEYEETSLLNNLIASIPDDHPLKQSLKQKIFSSSPLLPLADELIDKSLAKIISQLHEALQNKKQVRLIKYESLSSNTIKDRIIEPIGFVRASSQLEAFDLENNTIKQFKIKRITSVEILQTEICHQHNNFPTDLFGFTGPDSIDVKLQLSPLAHKLLIEEYPDARTFITKNQNTTIFSYSVRNLRGISRFILGLIGEIKIIAPQDLIDFVNNKLDNHNRLTN